MIQRQALLFVALEMATPLLGDTSHSVHTLVATRGSPEYFPSNEQKAMVESSHFQVANGNSSVLDQLSQVDRCRLFPTWSLSERETEEYGEIVSWELCSRALNYFPHNYNLFNGSSPDFPHENMAWMHELHDCMYNAHEQRLEQYRDEFFLQVEDDGYDKQAFWDIFLQQHPLDTTSVVLEYPSMDVLSQQESEENAERVPPVAMIVKNAMHIREADTFDDLRMCVQQNHSNLRENRPFGEHDDKGGNNCVFLGGFLQWFAPGVAAQIRRTGHVAWEHGRWGNFTPPDTDIHPYGYKDPLDSGIRTSEHLSYDGWKELGPHKDSDSLYTVLVMLSDPRDYDGGEFHLRVDRSGEQPERQRSLDESHHPMIAKPDKYSAVVFMAEENMHQVLNIHGGNRRTAATEFWEYVDVPFGSMRPKPDL